MSELLNGRKKQVLYHLMLVPGKIHQCCVVREHMGKEQSFSSYHYSFFLSFFIFFWKSIKQQNRKGILYISFTAFHSFIYSVSSLFLCERFIATCWFFAFSDHKFVLGVVAWCSFGCDCCLLYCANSTGVWSGASNPDLRAWVLNVEQWGKKTALSFGLITK